MIPGVVAGGARPQGGGAATQVFVFDPSDKHANVTLSNGNKTASAATGSGNYYVMCDTPKDSGKWIFEFLIDSMPTGGYVTVGMSDSPARSTTAGTSFAQVDTGFGWFAAQNGTLARFYYGGSSGNYDSLSPAGSNVFASGDRITCTVDFSTEEVVVHRNGTPIYTKTVASINTGTFDYAPALKLWGGSTPAQVSIPSDIAHPVAGFTPWAP